MVDGKERLRSVSSYDEELPLTLDIAYLLDGEEVEPGDVVGESGELEVRYHVENVTGEEQQIEVPDGTGGSVTRTADVVVPLVGSLTTTAAENFTDVQSEQANVAGDGRGGTRLSFTMTLFPPIGAATSDFGYTATITDGVVPNASISALPVNPMDVPSFAAGAESYRGGSETGADLTAGATEIDENLLELRDGAQTLSAGLITLYEGADQLSAGLNQDAVPGSDQLADGADELSAGAGELADGTGLLDDGARRLYDGADELSDGADRLDDGAGQVSDGAGQLADGAGELNDGANQLADGAGQVSDGVGELADGANQLSDGLNQAEESAPTLLGGLRQVRQGLRLVDDGLVTLGGRVGAGGEQLQAGVTQLRDGISGKLMPGIAQIREGVSTRIRPGIAALDGGVKCQSLLMGYLLNEGALAPNPACGIATGLPPIGPLAGADLPTQVRIRVITDLKGAVDGLFIPGTTELLAGIDGRLVPGLDSLACGLNNPGGVDCNGEGLPDTGLLQGIDQLGGGIRQLVEGVQGGIGGPRDTPADDTLRGGVNGLQEGTGQLVAGGETLLDGLGDLSDGGDLLYGGTGDLAAGTGDLADGAGTLAGGTGDLAAGAGDLADGAGVLSGGTGELSDGASPLADGADTLADGTGELDAGADKLAEGSGRRSDGAGELADGLGDAADGSSQIRDGLEDASDGAPDIVDGAGRLSEEGTELLVEAGSETTLTFGERYALIVAGGERADAESMAFGAPEGAEGITAYTFEIQGEDGTGTRNWARGLAALGVFGAGAGIMLLRRHLYA